MLGSRPGGPRCCAGSPRRVKHWRASACSSTRTGPPVRRARRVADGLARRRQMRLRRPAGRPRPRWQCRPGAGLAACPGWHWPRSKRHRHCTCANQPTPPAAPGRTDQTDRPRHPLPARRAPGWPGHGAHGRRTPGRHARGGPQRQRGLRRRLRQRHGRARTSPSWRPPWREPVPPVPTARSAVIGSFSTPGDCTPSPKTRHRLAGRRAVSSPRTACLLSDINNVSVKAWAWMMQGRPVNIGALYRLPHPAGLSRLLCLMAWQCRQAARA